MIKRLSNYTNAPLSGARRETNTSGPNVRLADLHLSAVAQLN